MFGHYHFIGIGGIGMSGLARLILDQGYSVSGSDLAFNSTIESLQNSGIVVYNSHSADHVPSNSKVVFSTDIKIDNPEYQAALNRNCKLLHRSDLLVEISKGRHAIAVAGTHGKTTTSSLLATVLIEGGMDPSFAIGGVVTSFQSNAHSGNGKLFVFEADESDQTFLNYHPLGAIVTNIDHDHLSNYGGDKNQVVQAFHRFMKQVVSEDFLFWCADDPYLKQINSVGSSYGVSKSADWKIISSHQIGFSSFIDLEHCGNYYKNIELSLIGAHNVLNATAVFGLALALGVSEGDVRKSFKKFKGVKRRCELKGNHKGISIIDDYAHHPTEIQTTLNGIRHAEPLKRLIALFQPHRFTRTRDCLGLYGTIFTSADEVIITDIYSADEVPIQGVDSQQIVEEVLLSSSVKCSYIPRDALTLYLSEKLQVNDLLITFGAGDITKVCAEILAVI